MSRKHPLKLRSSKVIYLLKQNHNWKRAKSKFGISNVQRSTTNDDFAEHLLEIHENFCTSCLSDVNPFHSNISKQTELDCNKSVRQMLLDLNQTIQKRFLQIDNCFKKANRDYETLRNKVDKLSSLMRNQSSNLLKNYSENGESFESNVAIIRLNKESNYPNGSWLGDPNKLLERVRCKITPTDLFHINATCHTPEKMALTLLDYLVDKKTQAESNISGHGRPCKKQLNPLVVYGIQCHLKKHFSLDYKMWNKIKLNIDSKCRSAYRRKLRGLQLRFKTISGGGNLDHTSDDYLAFTEEEAGTESRIIKTEDGDIRIVQGTADTLAQLKDLHQYEIVTDENLINVIEKETSLSENKDF